MNDEGLPARRLLAWHDPHAPLDAGRRALLAQAGWRVLEIADPEAAHALPAAPEAIAMRIGAGDAALPPTSLSALATRWPIIARIDGSDVAVAAAATRSGAAAVVAADDFDPARWRDCLRPLPAASRRARAAVFVDPVSQHLLALARRVAQAEVTTLLSGPTGAGKEVLARVLHECSRRASGPFVALNCAAMPETLIEDLLFGHERGAFTGAHREHRGVLEQAHRGTLFLDEIGDMPLHLQAKLLRVLQERQVTRLGASASIELDVRVIAATARDLRVAIARREFREDLFYRIATFQLRIAPLAERPGDILPLAHECLARHAAPAGGRWEIDTEAQALLLRHPWPGNVRELDNVMQRAAVLANDPRITPRELLFDDAFADGSSIGPGAPGRMPPMPAQPAVEAAASSAASGADAEPPMTPAPHAPAGKLPEAVRHSEFHLIQAALAACESRSEAAQRLGISPRTLRYKLARWRELGRTVAERVPDTRNA
jgi:two-component system response regulator FlrC